MNPDAFLADVLDEPATLERVLREADVAELRRAIGEARLVVLTGMGSSRYAALTAAAHLRAAGVPAVVEYASADVATRPGPGVLAIGISATGNSAETVAALAAHHRTSRTVALTNADDGGLLAQHADITLTLDAGRRRRVQVLPGDARGPTARGRHCQGPPAAGRPRAAGPHRRARRLARRAARPPGAHVDHRHHLRDRARGPDLVRRAVGAHAARGPARPG
jgi:hypothetical protein